MGIIARQGAKSTVVIMFGMVLGYLINLVVYPFCLNPEEIGLVRVLISAGTMYATFLPFGSNNALIKYYPEYKNPKNGHNGLFSVVLGTGIVTGIIALIILFLSQGWLYELYGSQMDSFSHFTLHLAILMVIISFTNILQDYCKSLLRIAFPFFLKQVLQRVFIATATIIYFLGFTTLTEFIMSIELAYFLVLIGHLFYMIKLGAVRIKFGSPFKSKMERNGFFKFSSFAVLSGLSMILLDNIDILMLGALSGLGTSGVYSISFFIAQVVDVPRRAVMRISTPVVSEAFKKNDFNKVKLLYQKSSLNAFFTGSILFLLIWTNIDSIFSIMPKGEIYSAGKNVVIILGLARLVDIMFGINGEILMMSKFYRLNAFFVLILVILTFITNLILIPKYGISGAAYGTAISIFIFNIIKHVFLIKKFGFSPFTSNLVKLAFIFLFILIIQVVIPQTNNIWINILINSLFVIVSFVSLFKIVKVKTDLVDQLTLKISKIIRNGS